jgi:hypothetical protein
MFALILPLMFAVCDLGEYFARPEAWEEPAVDFAVDHQSDGFGFASQKRDIVNCMRRGACTWHGLDVWEARIYYGAEGATRVEMSLYNRGDDSGDGLDSVGLKALLDEVASNAQPGGKIGSNPEKRKLRSGGFQFSKRWDKGDNPVELAWGVSGSNAKDRTVDFVRVTVTPKQKKVARSQPRNVSGIEAKAKVKSHVKKNGDGDVWIDGVPMVDQGKKGYCAAATSERILRYYGFNIDEHEIAQAAGTTAEGGTSMSEMKDTVRAVGSKCRLGYQDILAMATSWDDFEKEVSQYNKVAKSEHEQEISIEDFMNGRRVNVGEVFAAMKPKIVKKMRVKDMRYKKFLSGVKNQVDQGVPVFWGVTLGMFPEPGLPQTAGGHIRLIIGYNSKTHEILYTDTWGAGHELKRMPEDWAFAITRDAFYLKPL